MAEELDYKYVWVKCRTLHSSRPSSWRFQEETQPLDMSDEDFLQSLAEDYANEHNTHTEHFRGAEVDFGTPSKDFLENSIEIAKRRMKNTKDYITRQKELLKSLPDE